MDSEVGVRLVEAARTGDTGAQDELVATCLPLVYNIVGRALKGHADVDDVVQETMIRALNGLDGLRDAACFRSWLVSITMNQIRSHWQQEHRDAPIGGLREVHEVAAPAPDFADATIVRLGLEGQRKEVAEATRWLDDDQRQVLSLWWLEAAGELTRAEVATALELPPQHAAVRVQRTKEQLETARVVVRALGATPRCGELEQLVGLWDGVPSALWRKRIARHARGCADCSGHWSALVPAEGLLVALGLVPIAGALLRWRASDAASPAIAPAAYASPTAAGASPMAAGASPADPVVTSAGAPPASAISPAGAPPAHPADTHVMSRAGRHRTHRRPRTGGKAVGAAALVMAVGGAAFVLNLPGNEDERVESGAPHAAPLADRLPSATPSTPQRKTTEPASRSDEPTRRPVTKAPHTTPPSPRPTKTAPATPTARPTPSPTPRATQAADPRARLAQQVTALVNAERAKAGCAPVRPNDQLTTAAQRHSDDMAARHYFDHTEPDGSGPGERITAAGYQWQTYGENIAAGQQSPRTVMDSWMNSPGHRQNILNCDVTEIGVGVTDDSGGPLWTQVFATR
ncbi:sigma-70 family RNA polymerase sigma factor [Streptomyces sp. XD-27]|uniref:sigma-70 family RNA polymerase sigma factor n=1 Tax=Streptomyces sp. XD-27 TaxID=3062779 RepID=UPI0026F40EC7|nr:sigma-70 family RNA polymerase sigma factor [Streptomyces sp. XD-27]WKX69197.1 sigma-70 family RNA polymerase sigma factor [Streptomyces sp. XD-27]